MNLPNELARIRKDIESLIENLDDVVFAVLREAARESGDRPAADKTLLQARRALEKASRLLDSMDVIG